MRRVMMIAVALMLVGNVKTAAEKVDVGSFTYLNEILISSEEYTIRIGRQIISEKDYDGVVGIKTITGGSNSLIGSSGNKIYRGFSLRKSGDKLTIINKLAMEKFAGALKCNAGSQLSIVDGRNITFSGNNANVVGGAMACGDGSNVNISGSIVMFSSNSANVSGGAMFCQDSRLSISSSSVIFSGNNANEQGGAMACGDGSNVSIGGSSMMFSSNNASYGGGAMFCQDSRLSINSSSVIFSGNNVNEHGGAMFCGVGSNVNIGGSIVMFSSNSANVKGGAMICQDSRLSVIDSNLTFSSNNASYGGAMFCQDSRLSISSSSVIFSGNNTTVSGGAMACGVGSNVNISNLIVMFSSNSANVDGGAMFCEKSRLSINSSSVIFSGNNANEHGGAMFCGVGLNVTIWDSIVIFSNNRAMKTGGSICCNGATMEFVNSQITFDSNIANQGGGAYIRNGIVTLTNASFRNNSAIQSGGGVYLEESELTLVADSGKVIEFSGNSANGKSNGIYVDAGGAIVKFQGEGQVNIYDAIDANNGDIIIDCKFNLKTDEAFETRNLTILESGILNTQNGKKNKVKIVEVYSQRGEWAINIKKELEEEEFYVSDCLDAGRVVLGENSKLAVDMSEVAGDSKLRLYKLIKYGSLNGEFKEVEFTGVSSSPKYDIVYDYENQWVTLRVEGETDLTEKGKQKTMVRLMDTQKYGQKALMPNNISGYFISNIIKGVGREGIGTEVERRLMEEKDNESGIWVDIGVKRIKESKDENSPEEYKEEIKGVTGGYDKKAGKEEGNRIGMYGRYKELEATQGENKGGVKKGAIGLYVSGSRRDIDIKAVVEGRMDKYTTTREGEDKKINEGKFGDIGVAAEGEVVYNGLKSAIRPYVGIRIGVLSTEGFKEEGETPLDVKDNNYVRGSMRAGIRTRVEKKKIKCTIGVGVECCAIGRENEIKGTVVKTGEEFRIKSVKEGVIRGEGEIGIEYELNGRTGIYAKALGGVGSYSDIGGNIGVRYVFGR
jgi:predicted outer membrane repeat protein